MKAQNVSTVRVSRDGSVRFWNVFTQTWQTVPAIDLVADRAMATLPKSERRRVRRAATKSVSLADVRELRGECVEFGDREMVRACDRALDGSRTAFIRCALAILESKAQYAKALAA